MTDFKQELFDEALVHIRRQGSPSHQPGDASYCMYRGPEGKGCAAAIFISQYGAGMEALPWSHVVARYGDNLDPRAVQNEEFVNNIQKAHDDAASYAEVRVERDDDADEYMVKDSLFLDEFELGMQRLAEDYGLNYDRAA